jgi:hypothetical protein
MSFETASGQARVCLLLGHPRSGTTFLHRFMLENYRGLVGKKLEDMVFLPQGPRILKPVKSIARKLPLSWLYRPEIHSTGMGCWESDDIAFSIHCKAGYLHWLYGPCRKRSRFDSEEFHAWVSDRKEQVLKCWNALSRNQLNSEKGTGILSQSFMMLFYLEEFFERYPNAKVILLTRSPAEVAPSTISLVNSVCRRLFPFRQLHEAAIANIYHSLSLYYQRISSVLANPLVADRCLHLNYADVTTQLASGCNRISDYLAFGSWDEAAVGAQSVKQAKWASAHHYDARDFGLSAEKITQEVPYG